MKIEGHEYTVLKGSDIERDGMFLELYLGREPKGRPLAECFYADADGSLSVTVYEARVPGAALAWLEGEGARMLPPDDRTA